MRIPLVLILSHGLSPVFGQRRSWMCSLNAIPSENITLPHDFRHLLEGPRFEDAIAVSSGGNIERQTRSDNNSSEEMEISTPYLLVRPCTCANRHSSIVDNFYCPEPSNYCVVFKSFYGDDYSVTCSRYKGWIILFARSAWFYVCWIITLFLILLIFTSSGHHAVRYPISRCFSRMNPWIADHLLQTEIESHNRVRDDYLTAARVKRQTEGWISGYIIRTKIHSVANDSTAAGDASMTRGNRGGGYDSMCTICLLELEDGDRVADLPCGHMYHAECLGEWILKRNSCPLCQDPDVAKVIRSYEAKDDGNDRESNSVSRMARWHCRSREYFLDVATGRNQQGRRMNSLRGQSFSSGG